LRGAIHLARWLVPKSKVFHFNPETFFSSSWGEEQQLVFVVLPKPKSDDAMLDST
jgi:hypothetical protein